MKGKYIHIGICAKANILMRESNICAKANILMQASNICANANILMRESNIRDSDFLPSDCADDKQFQRDEH